ncbi:MAG: PAS domain S-box protein [Nitrospirae bacterium]|nr:MAG: PAS domain S-box protein [Nitrospirota bacterium]
MAASPSFPPSSPQKLAKESPSPLPRSTFLPQSPHRFAPPPDHQDVCPEQGKEQLAELYELAPVGLVILDCHGTIHRANRMACLLLSMDQPDSMGRPFARCFVRSDRARIRRHLRETAQASHPQTSELFTVARTHPHRTVRLSTLWLEPAWYHVAIVEVAGQDDKAQSRQDHQAWIFGILDNAMDAIVTVDEAQRIVLFNKAAEAMFRCPASAALGRPVEQFIPVRFRKAHREHLRRFSQTGMTTRTMQSLGQVYGLRADGQEFPVEASISRTDIHGKKLLTVIFRDMTEREQIARTLAREREFIDTVLETAGALVVVLDPQGRIVRFNRACEQLTGLAFSDVRGNVIWDVGIVPCSEKDSVKHMFTQLCAGVFPLYCENTWLTKTREARVISWANTALTDEYGQVQYIVGTGIDITEQKHAETRLRESEERFYAFMNHTPAVAFLKDEHGRYVFVNRRFEEKLGRSKLECLGKTDRQLFPPEVARVFTETDHEALQSGEVIEGEETTLDLEGKPRHWIVLKFRVPSARGQPLVGGLALEITPLKTALEALRQKTAELRRSQEALQALSGRLITAQEEERRRIAQELHDDLNQRLAVLALTIQAEQHTRPPSDPVFTFLEHVYEHVSQISDEIRRLAYQLHPSKIEDLGLEVALESLVKDFSRLRGISVGFQAKDVPRAVPLPMASCLYRIAQEGLMNIARHAYATNVEITLERRDGGLRLIIKDNGVGFDPATLRAGPHGLGLVTMQERIRHVNGILSLQTAKGKGTELAAWVPLVAEELMA